MIEDTIKALLTDALTLAKADIIKSYQQKGLKASGDFEKGLEVNVRSYMGMVSGVMLGEHYTQYMQNGRRPNKEQTAKQARGLGKILEQWVKDKGIDVNPYAAAWKIVREGIKVPNKYNPGGVISDVLTENWMLNVQKSLGEGVQNQIMSDLYNFYKNGNNNI